MDKKEFIFPGVVLGLVLVTALGLLLTQGKTPSKPLITEAATSTASTTEGTSTPAKASEQPAPAKSASAPHTAPAAGPQYYYPYGMVTLSVNQAAGFKDGLSIRPVQVVEDSRCPLGVECIQAGALRISLKSSINGQSAYQTIALGKSITLHGDTITLVSAEPARTKDSVPAQAAYRLTFKVEPK